MEPLDLSNEILLEDILDTNEYVHSEKRNLVKAVIEHFPPHSVIYFLEFVENSIYENKYYGYIFNGTENKIYQFSFTDNKEFKNVKLNLRHRDRKKLTKKDILALDIIDLL